MGTDVPVGDAAGYPHDAFVRIPAVHRIAPLADHLEDPSLVLVHDRERFAAGGIAVGIGQLHDRGDGFPRRRGSLEGQVDERTVIDSPVGIDQFRPTAVGGFRNDQLSVVHVSYGGIGAGSLRNVAQVAPRIPFVDRYQRPGLVAFARGVVFVEGPVELVRIGRIAHHGRTVGRSPFRDDEVGAGGCGPRTQGRQQAGCQENFFHFIKQLIDRSIVLRKANIRKLCVFLP